LKEMVCMRTGSADGAVVVATWEFGKVCVQAAVAALEKGGTALDAVEQAAWVAEEDGSNASVGYGGNPNSDGVVQVDAAIMWGADHGAGSVAALEGVLHPVSVARRVMEQSSHVMLVGEGARKFAVAQGFEQVELLTPEARERWKKWKKEQGATENHDTIGVVALDGDGNLAASCSTSGAGFKHPGRVGDSPIIGSGLYVDGEVGAAAATGQGEDIMRHCACYAVVAHMARGLAPDEACLETLRYMAQRDPRGADIAIGIVAVDKQGRYAGAGMRKGFPYACGTAGEIQVIQGVWVKEK
jgi:N4-(beta-N-acetylglucosaminyl)-L-asparaginase